MISTMPSQLAIHLDPARATKLVEAGLPWRDAKLLAAALDLSLTQLAGYLGIPTPTFFRRRSQGRFTAEESDHIMRFARLWSLTEGVFEDTIGARSWLKGRQKALQGRIPIEVAKSEAGAREVEFLLQRIESGWPIF